MSFREFLNEVGRGSSSDSVLPLRGMVKGNTIQKNAESALEFFSHPVGGIIIESEMVGPNRHKSPKKYIVYTSGSGKKMADMYIKDDYQITLIHDQTFKQIGTFEIVGWFDIDKNGNISGNVSASEKINGSYTFK